MLEAAVPLGAETAAQLDLSAWNGLEEGERERVAREVLRGLEAAGHAFESPEIRFHGPAGEQPVLELRDRSRGLTFALVPGGEFAPGYDEEELAAYARVHRRMFGWPDEAPWTDADWEEEPPEEYEYYDPPARTMVFGSARTCDLRRKPAGRAGPFLTTVLPVHAGVPGIGGRSAGAGEGEEDRGELAPEERPARITRRRLPGVLSRCGWDVPSSREYEWALRGGERGLFYWGDGLPAFVLEQGPMPDLEGDEEELERAAREVSVRFEDVMLERIEPERPRAWPYANRFGFAGMLAWSAWCAAGGGESARRRLVTRGGAVECAPWQGCGEWKLLLNAVEGGSDALVPPVLRPVIRLVPRE